jgi:hypothetical protein
MAGRPPLRREETAAPDGVPVAEMRLTVTGPDEGEWLVVRRGTTAHAVPASLAEPADGAELPASLLPASLLPVWLASVTGTGPRPVPRERPLLIVTRSALDRLLDRTGPADVRTALEAPDLTDAETEELGALSGGLVRRWVLAWISGRDEDLGPRLEARGHLEILDAGSHHGLWRVLTDLPEELTAELPGEQPVGLMRTAPADIWHELTLPLIA